MSLVRRRWPLNITCHFRHKQSSVSRLTMSRRFPLPSETSVTAIDPSSTQLNRTNKQLYNFWPDPTLFRMVLWLNDWYTRSWISVSVRSLLAISPVPRQKSYVRKYQWMVTLPIRCSISNWMTSWNVHEFLQFTKICAIRLRVYSTFRRTFPTGDKFLQACNLEKFPLSEISLIQHELVFESRQFRFHVS